MNEYDYITNAFTKEGENTNLEVNNLHVGCITSKENKFELDSNGNLTVQSLKVKDTHIDNIVMRDFIYPVGSIYMSVNEINPNTLFGGTWEQIKDKFLLASGEVYKNGTTGGEANHTLTIEEMPSHSHNFTSGTANIIANQLSNNSPCHWNANNQGLGTTQIGWTGGSFPHNNMPPYLAVYMWKRIK